MLTVFPYRAHGIDDPDAEQDISGIEQTIRQGCPLSR